MIKIKSHKENKKFADQAGDKLYDAFHYIWHVRQENDSHYVTDEFAIKMERVTNGLIILIFLQPS
jgi:hypothetical protein